MKQLLQGCRVFCVTRSSSTATSSQQLSFVTTARKIADFGTRFYILLEPQRESHTYKTDFWSFRSLFFKCSPVNNRELQEFHQEDALSMRRTSQSCWRHEGLLPIFCREPSRTLTLYKAEKGRRRPCLDTPRPKLN